MLFSLNSRSFLLCFVVLLLLPQFVFNYIVEYSKCIYRFVTIFDLGLCSMNFDKHSLNPIPSSIHTSRVYLYIHRNQTHVSWLYQQWTLENVVCKSSESINQCTCSLLIKLLYWKVMTMRSFSIATLSSNHIASKCCCNCEIIWNTNYVVCALVTLKQNKTKTISKRNIKRNNAQFLFRMIMMELKIGFPFHLRVSVHPFIRPSVRTYVHLHSLISLTWTLLVLLALGRHRRHFLLQFGFISRLQIQIQHWRCLANELI